MGGKKHTPTGDFTVAFGHGAHTSLYMKAFGDENEATPDSACPNRHPTGWTFHLSEPLNLTPPPTVTESKGAEPPTGEEEEEEFPV